MNKPILKNHVVIDQITIFEQFVAVIHTEPTVYVQPWHKVHPGQFFNSRVNYPPEKLKKMIANGYFWRVKKKTEIQKSRFRTQIAEIERFMQTPTLHPDATIADVFLAIDL